MYATAYLFRMYKAMGSIHGTESRDKRKLIFLNSYNQFMALQKKIKNT